MLKEFKEFALRGNVIDLAIGIIIGGAFGLIVNSVVNDLFMPLFGTLFNASFSNLYLPLSKEVSAALEANPNLTLAEAKALGPVFAWGNFTTVVINFILLAFVIFVITKIINSLKKKEEAKPAAAAELPMEVKLLTEIRDLLKNR